MRAVPRGRSVRRFCNLTNFQVVDLKAFFRENRQKMHEKDEYPVDDAVAPVASVSERVDFISFDGAFNYGEKRAREFIESKLACESA